MPDNAVVADSTVLIFLGKLRHLDWLREAYDFVLIPSHVYEEVVEQGKDLGENDAYLVETAISDGWIEVHEVDKQPEVENYGLEDGETEAISLALDRDHEEILLDEESAREVARLQGLQPHGTLYFLSIAIREGNLTFEGFIQQLEKLLEIGFYLDEAVYLEAIRKARQLANQDSS